MSSYTTGVDPHIANAPALSVLTKALGTFQSVAPDSTSALFSLSSTYVSWSARPTDSETNTPAIPPSYNDPKTSNTMNSLTSDAPTATPINGGVLPYLATIGTVIVLTGESYTLTAAIPSTDTDALAIIGATLSPGGPAASLGDYVFSLGTDGVEFISGSATDTLRTSTYGSGQTTLEESSSSTRIPPVVTMRSSTTESSATETPESTSPSSTTSAPATTSTEASAGQKHTVMWSVGAMGLLLAAIYAL
ncbi:hypothetical protein CKM354_000659600 [Cercospora kikuchii]|uniref:Uncharacterized protein n=1 Tax=Cercospora kikuchii TaxID=84275 RepID=A0A9P3FDG8_9PEZI|nr:uncharacterized protein CKM354_000659600 [Cercospora kikuchii]GIZ43366.1 hypothetical protein CKM354_000659600 [Cercospora kikuchii]